MQWTSTKAHGDKPIEPISDAELETLRREAIVISERPQITAFQLACLIKRLDVAEDHPNSYPSGE